MNTGEKKNLSHEAVLFVFATVVYFSLKKKNKREGERIERMHRVEF